MTRRPHIANNVVAEPAVLAAAPTNDIDDRAQQHNKEHTNSSNTHNPQHLTPPVSYSAHVCTVPVTTEETDTFNSTGPGTSAEMMSLRELYPSL